MTPYRKRSAVSGRLKLATGDRIKTYHFYFFHQYDENNRLLSTSTSLPPSTTKLIDVIGYVDDAVSVIVEADNQVPAEINGVQFTAYDVKIHGGWNEIVATATDYQGKVRKDYADIALISSQDETFGYDDNGNMINRSENSSTTTYSYDLKNQLTGIDFPDSRPDHTYVYDGFGNRVQSNVGSETTKYIYSGNRSILELDGQDNVTAVLRGPGKGGGIGSIIKIERGGQSQYLHYNWRGDVVLVTGDNEEILQKYEYEAFGKQLNAISIDNDYQFSTKEFNEDSGLQYFGRRFYDPELGRFINPDPLWFIDGHNKYNFCLNNPIRFIDSLGEAITEIPKPEGYEEWPDELQKKYMDYVKKRFPCGIFGLGPELIWEIPQTIIRWRAYRNALHEYEEQMKGSSKQKPIEVKK